MKWIVFAFFVLPFSALAQDCQLKKEKDPFSQQARISTGFMKFAHNQGNVSVSMVADAKEIKLLFSFGPDVCFDDQSTVAVSFDSTRTKTNQRNMTAMNCDGIFSLIFRNGATTPGALQKFGTHNVASMIVTNTSGKKMEIVLTPEQKKTLRQRAACLIAEAKTLIKPAS